MATMLRKKRSFFNVFDVAQVTRLFSDAQALNARRFWVIDQLASLIRNGAIPKDDHWVMTVLDWFVVRGLFVVRSENAKSPFLAVCCVIPPPFQTLDISFQVRKLGSAFPDEVGEACRVRLLSCLAELTTHVTVVKGGHFLSGHPSCCLLFTRFLQRTNRTRHRVSLPMVFFGL
jgi:hypothetical protein